MHVDLPSAALILVQSIFIVAAIPLIPTSLSPIAIADPPSQNLPDVPLTLISGSVNHTSTALQNQPNSPSNTSNGLTPFRVPGSRTTLLFHSFGVPIPARDLLDCLALSLSLVLEYTLSGRGKRHITSGLFTHNHVLPNGNNVTINVADFREVGRPMDYFTLKDTLKGIGEFVTEPGQRPVALSYEVEVEGKGYVGTGHLDYDVKESGA